MADNKFPAGFFFKDKHEKAPDFVKGTVSIKVAEAIDYLKTNANAGGYINLVLKVSKGGKKYFELDTWEPKKKDEQDTKSEEIVF